MTQQVELSKRELFVDAFLDIWPADALQAQDVYWAARSHANKMGALDWFASLSQGQWTALIIDRLHEKGWRFTRGMHWEWLG